MKATLQRKVPSWVMIVLFLVLVGLFSVPHIFDLIESNKPIYSSRQPSNIHYDALRDTYLFQAFRRLNEDIEIKISSEEGRFYSSNLDFVPKSGTIAKVDWRSEGIDITFSNNHKLFIPKKSFIGGR